MSSEKLPTKTRRRSPKRILSFLVIVAISAAALAAYETKNRPLKLVIDVEVLAPGADSLAVFCDDGSGYSGKKSVSLAYDDKARLDGRLYRFTVRVPCNEPVSRIRLDPIWGSGHVAVTRVEVQKYAGTVVDLETLTADAVRPLHSIETLDFRQGRLEIRASGADPHIQLMEDVSQFYEVSISRFSMDFLLYLVWCSVVLYLLLFLLRQAHSLYRYRLGSSLESRENSANGMRSVLLRRFADMVRSWVAGPTPGNSWAFAMAWVACFYGSWVFTLTVHQTVGAIALATTLGLQLQLLALASALYLCLSFTPLAIRRWIGPSFVLLAAVAYDVDAFIFTLNGMHLSHALSILLDGGIGNIVRNLKFTKLSTANILLYQSLVIALVLGCVAVTVLLGKYSSKTARILTPRVIAWTFGLCLLGAATEQTLGLSMKTGRHRFSEQATFPVYLGLYEVSDHLLALDVKVPRFDRHDKNASKVIIPDSVRRPDIYLIILESFRDDVITEETTPILWGFRQESLRFSKGLANGNSTHYGWFSILNSQHPIYWETFRAIDGVKGAGPLVLFKRLGYDIKIHTAKDLRYLGAGKTIFGYASVDELPSESSDVIDYITKRPSWPSQKLDQFVADDLSSLIRQGDSTAPTLHIVFFDSTHYPYRWAKDFSNVREPVVGTHESGPSLGTAKALLATDRHLLWNRYLNSVAYTDMLIGQVFDTLKQNEGWDSSAVIVVGDHGQQFGEHGFFMHGHTLFDVDMRVPLFLRLPGVTAEEIDGIASQIDIMPTLFDFMGLREAEMLVSDGHSLLRTSELLHYSLGAAAGYQNTPYMLDVEILKNKLFMELERNNPLRSKTLLVRRILDVDEQEMTVGDGSGAQVNKFFRQHFEEALLDLGFFSKD